MTKIPHHTYANHKLNLSMNECTRLISNWTRADKQRTIDDLEQTNEVIYALYCLFQYHILSKSYRDIEAFKKALEKWERAEE